MQFVFMHDGKHRRHKEVLAKRGKLKLIWLMTHMGFGYEKCIFNSNILINSLRPSDAYMRQ